MTFLVSETILLRESEAARPGGCCIASQAFSGLFCGGKRHGTSGCVGVNDGRDGTGPGFSFWRNVFYVWGGVDCHVIVQGVGRE